jgi:hypothetical protein
MEKKEKKEIRTKRKHWQEEERVKMKVGNKRRREKNKQQK